MSQDKERDAFERRMLDFGWRNFTGDVQGEPPCWYYANADLNARWIGWREARAALASQPPAVQGEPQPVAYFYTLEYGNTVADTKLSARQLNYPFGVCGADYARSNGDGVSYVRQIPLYASPPSREPLTELLIEAEFGSDSNESYPDFLAGVRFAERFHGIHSREGGSK